MKPFVAIDGVLDNLFFLIFKGRFPLTIVPNLRICIVCSKRFLDRAFELNGGSYEPYAISVLAQSASKMYEKVAARRY